MPTTMKLIAKNVLGSDTASVTLSSIPGTYDDLLLLVSARTSHTVAEETLAMTFNSNTSNYSFRQLFGTGSAAGSNAVSNTNAIPTNGATSTSNTFSSAEVLIPNYAGSANKSYSISGVVENNATAASVAARAHLWANTAAITSITLTPISGLNLVSGSSFFLYGITKA